MERVASKVIEALTGLEMPFLWELITKVDLQPAVFKGVTLLPMDYDNCSLQLCN